MSNNDEDKVKELIRQRIINNLECIIDSIYDSMQSQGTESLPSSTDLTELIRFINDSEETTELDYHLGKQSPPPPKILPNGQLESYIEIKTDAICDKIKICNEIFRRDYRFTYYKKDDVSQLPKSIKNILNKHRLLLKLEKEKKWKSIEHIRKWLMGVALVGYIRMIKKANAPYLLEHEITDAVKGFLINVENLYKVITKEKIMCDPENKGLTLWDTQNIHNSERLVFRKKGKKKSE